MEVLEGFGMTGIKNLFFRLNLNEIATKNICLLFNWSKDKVIDSIYIIN